MPIPIRLDAPPEGARYDPTAIDATGATLGDYLGAVSDLSGGQRAGYLPLPVSPDDVDPGVGAGTPGNLMLPFVVESGDDDPLVLGPHGIGLEHIPAGWVRANLQAGAEARGQATIAVKGYVTAYLEVKYSTDGGVTWPDGQVLGIQVPLGLVNPTPGTTVEHQVGFAVAVPAGAAGDVVMRPAVGGGDGITIPEIVNFLVKVTSAEQPPETGEGTPAPGTPALPGPAAPWGTVILDFNARLGIVAANLARAIPWEDQSTSNNDAATDAFGGSVRSGGEYHTSGWRGGALPYVKSKAANYGWVSPSGYSGAETLYILLDQITGGGVGNVGGNEAANIAASDGGGGGNFWLRMQGDGFLFIMAGVSFFGTPQGTGTHNVADGQPHIIRVVHAPGAGNVSVYVDGALDISVSNAVIVNGWTGTQIYFGTGSLEGNVLTANWMRVVRYNSEGDLTSHKKTSLNDAETAMLTAAGL